MRKTFFSALSAAAAVLFPLAVSAQVNAPSAAAVQASGAVFGGVLIFFAFFVLLALVIFIFWLLMLIDCIKRDWPDKNLWLILLVGSFFLGLNWLTAVLYYFIVKKPNLGPAPMAAPTPMPPQTPPTAPPAA